MRPQTAKLLNLVFALSALFALSAKPFSAPLHTARHTSAIAFRGYEIVGAAPAFDFLTNGVAGGVVLRPQEKKAGCDGA